jgi:hypothetical protein
LTPETVDRPRQLTALHLRLALPRGIANFIERQQAKSPACRPAQPRMPRMGNDQYDQIVSEAGRLEVGVGGGKQGPVSDFPTPFR